jgi:hypothetical protein
MSAFNLALQRPFDKVYLITNVAFYSSCLGSLGLRGVASKEMKGCFVSIVCLSLSFSLLWTLW